MRRLLLLCYIMISFTLPVYAEESLSLDQIEQMSKEKRWQETPTLDFKPFQWLDVSYYQRCDEYDRLNAIVKPEVHEAIHLLMQDRIGGTEFIDFYDRVMNPSEAQLKNMMYMLTRCHVFIVS